MHNQGQCRLGLNLVGRLYLKDKVIECQYREGTTHCVVEDTKTCVLSKC